MGVVYMKGHLQVFSCYSFQNSTALIEELCKQAAALNFQGFALTDNNNMYGAMEFTKLAKKYHLKPVYGLTASTLIEGGIYPLLLLAKDNIGYQALLQFTSKINLNEIKAIELADIQKYKEHLFVLSANQEGIIERSFLKALDQEALRLMKYFKEIFGASFYLCLQDQNNAMQKKNNQDLIALARVCGIKVCCSNEVRMVTAAETDALEILLAISQNRYLEAKFKPTVGEKYLKDSWEMESSFDKEIIDNTDYIFDQCNVSLVTGKIQLPKYPIPNDGDSFAYLVQLCKVGLKKRFNDQAIPVNYKQRLQYELSVINKMGFNDYFLIVFDYVRYAKIKGILVGPGRGSAAGSLVAYVLGITNIDPLKYDLLFERFLNPERISLPDIDIDFQDDRRDEVVNYVIEKYGQDYVAQIVTFTSYGPKVAIKDLGKALGFKLPTLERATKYIPTGYRFKKTIKEVFESSNNFQRLIRSADLERVIKAAMIVEKLPKNISQHAAGVVLSKDKLINVVPLVKGPLGLVTQYSKDYIEEIGLLKMDFLGLKNLTIISHIGKDIAKNQHQKLDINQLPLDDDQTFKMLAQGDTFGIFQLESPGMKNLLRKLKTDSLDDIIAAIALYRPGPMQNIPTYIARKQGKEPIRYILPELKDILSSTYGIIIYQEQIMQIAQKIAGFSLAKADILRKAMSKKNGALMETMKEEFIQGGLNKGFSQEKISHLYAWIEEFANYGFNKSHSVAYGYIAYQLAYLKTHYPLEFYSAILSNEQGSDTNKLTCIQESKRYGVKILPPSINYSINRFKVEDKNIRYSLLAIKNVGHNVYQSIIKEREERGLFKDIYDFLARMEGKNISSLVLESLIKAGAFDEFKLNRATLLKNLGVIQEFSSLQSTVLITEPPILEMVKENNHFRLENEKEVLGLYLSNHPVVLYKQRFNSQVINVDKLDQYLNQTVNIILVISRIRVINDKKGNEMCFIEGYDESGNVEGVVFATVYQAYKNSLNKGAVCLINGKVNFRDKLSLLINKIKILNEG